MNTSQLHKAFDSLLPTEEQKEAMICKILIDRDGAPQRRRRGNPVRLAVLAAAALTLCVVTASAAEALGVSQMIRDYFQQKEEVSVMDKLNVAASGLNTTTEDGWKITITDLFGDDNRWLMGVTVEAPAGTVLDQSDYKLRLTTNGTPDTMPEYVHQNRQKQEEIRQRLGVNVQKDKDYDVTYLNYLQHNHWLANQVPDENPRDNKVSFVFDNNATFYQDGIVLDFTFDKLFLEERTIKELNATISNVATHFSSNGYHLTPNTSIQAFGGSATVSELTFTPLSISFELTGNDVKQNFFDLRGKTWIESKQRPTRPERYQRWRDSRAIKNNPDQAAIDWANKPMKDWDDDDWYGWKDDEWVLDTPLVLHLKDGTSQEVDLFGGISGYEHERCARTDTDEEKKALRVAYEFSSPLDLDTVDYITICDVRITLPADAVK